MKRIVLAAAFALLSSSAFAQPYQPYYQQTGDNTYSQDLAECRAYANQVSPVQDAAVGERPAVVDGRGPAGRS